MTRYRYFFHFISTSVPLLF